MKIKFIGAAREVTGSKHLITTNEGKRILLDCGMFQGKGLETDAMNRNLGFDPATIDYLLLSHAHIDHSGLIPYLYRQGFRGSVICTNATRDLCAIMLADSGHIQESDMKWFNKKRARKGLPPIEPIYNQHDTEACMKLFIGVAYDRRFYINDKINVKFTCSGHMLGSSVVNLELIEDGKKIHIAYTGDIGRRHNKILKAPDPFPQCDYLITESTYGNRRHSEENEKEDDLYKIVTHTCVEKKGKLIIPSFSIGRTQEIIFVLNNLYNKGKLPKVEVFIDSPLSVNATDIFRLHPECMNKEVNEVMKYDTDPFGFNSVHMIKLVEESKALNSYQRPCIIISSSGMMEAGRIKHHVANNISDPRNTILIVGYCAPNTLGYRIQEPGLRSISIFGVEYEIKAEISKIEAFSGHGDYVEMREFLSCQDPSKINKTFLVHGEYDVQQAYANYLHESGFVNIEIPGAGEEVEVN
ncbi:MAG TPA: MBL fold metallo-hydrolase [Paludibacter sp.]|nr:MBL fold metallo-hydrolase [Paludibacter sp.]